MIIFYYIKYVFLFFMISLTIGCTLNHLFSRSMENTYFSSVEKYTASIILFNLARSILSLLGRTLDLVFHSSLLVGHLIKYSGHALLSRYNTGKESASQSLALHRDILLFTIFGKRASSVSFLLKQLFSKSSLQVLWRAAPATKPRSFRELCYGKVKLYKSKHEEKIKNWLKEHV